MSRQIKVPAIEIFPIILESLKNNQIVELKISGSSMMPFLKHQKTTVGLQSFSGYLKRYHIYLFRLDEKYILHRFIRTKNDRLYFIGDALNRYEIPKIKDVLAEVKYMKEKDKKTYPYTFWKVFAFRFRTLLKRLKHLVKKIVRRQDESEY